MCTVQNDVCHRGRRYLSYLPKFLTSYFSSFRTDPSIVLPSNYTYILCESFEALCQTFEERRGGKMTNARLDPCCPSRRAALRRCFLLHICLRGGKIITSVA